ncbi:MAG: nucleotidyltransferase family protein, partial [Methanobacteriaceae archaeon]
MSIKAPSQEFIRGIINQDRKTFWEDFSRIDNGLKNEEFEIIIDNGAGKRSKSSNEISNSFNCEKSGYNNSNAGIAKYGINSNIHSNVNSNINSNINSNVVNNTTNTKPTKATKNTKATAPKTNDNLKIVADFTEYSPLHNGHFHCMNEAKKAFPNSIFVAIVPGLFERSGRGLPYIMTRYARSEAAIAVGADIVIEGPPMGIMGSGQYSLCLAKTFKAINTDIIPRGYKPVEGFDIIMDRVTRGHGVAPKPYKIVDTDTSEILLRGKLEEDNYVITSLSKSLKKINFDFKNKFFFVKRIEGVSGTIIRQATIDGNLESAKTMLPQETRFILERELDLGQAPLHNSRDEIAILESVNNMPKEELSKLNLINGDTADNIINTKKNLNNSNNEFESINSVKE